MVVTSQRLTYIADTIYMMVTVTSLSLFLLYVLPLVHADVDTYPVKSINLAAAFKPTFYDGYNTYNGLIPGISECHVTNGIQTADGGFVVTGSGTPEPDDGTLVAFAVKIDTNGTFQWVTQAQTE